LPACHARAANANLTTPANDMPAQVTFIAGLSGVAA